MRPTVKLHRRQFLKSLGAGAAIAGLPLASLADNALEGVSPKTLDRVKQLLGDNLTVDFHTHLGLWQNRGLEDIDPAFGVLSDEKLASNIQDYLTAGVNGIYLDVIGDLARTRVGAPGNKDRDFVGDEAWEDHLRQYELIEQFLGQLPIAVAHSGDEIAKANDAGKLAVILSAEGGHMLENDASRIDILYRQGLRRLQPIHYVASTLGDSQTDPVIHGGLSELGRQVLARASQLGMLLDMAHATQAAVEQTIDLVDRPIALSHTMVAYDSSNYGDYRNTRSRWITPEHARLIAKTGGVIGTFPVRAPWGVDSLDAFVEALWVMVDAVGFEHIAWSTDLVEAGRPEFLQNYAQFPILCAKLMESGFSEDDLLKFTGGNALRVQREATA
ncbi:membrane dipeptidase [Congregibacter variabilis]|uniref:Membrane dipeptidase n=1 Tax=Congregibacter variabilis TaxID=3081200 RepID=A0ABZ0HXI1_9GAMM|nr:membrane dipeptidase [Congregibacter sp. IMCC43200]